MVEVTCQTPKSQVADLGVLLSPCGGLLCTPAMQIGPGETLPFSSGAAHSGREGFVGHASPWSVCVGPCADLPQARDYSPGCKHMVAHGVHL